MARAGRGKPLKVNSISSGRLVNFPSVLKKKVSQSHKTAVDVGYSLYSTDSEDQVTTIHYGLDRCAALLNGMLKMERPAARQSCTKRGKTVPAQPMAKVVKGGNKKKPAKSDSRISKVSVQSVHTVKQSLESQLKEMKKEVEALRKENQELQQKNLELMQLTKDYEEELLQLRQCTEREKNSTLLDMNTTSELKNSLPAVDVPEKDNAHPSLGLQQSEANVYRLQQVTSEMPSVALEAAVEEKVSDLCSHQRIETFHSSPISETISKFLNSLEADEVPRPPEEPCCSKWNQEVVPVLLKDAKPLGDLGRFSPLGNINPVKSLEHSDHTKDGIGETKCVAPSFGHLHFAEKPLVQVPAFDITENFPDKSDKTHSSKSSTESMPQNTNLPPAVNRIHRGRLSMLDKTFSSCDIKSVASNWSASSWSSFNTIDEQEFRKGLALLDASIASLQRTIQSDLNR
ncbi:hypothetical protein GJAV_G00204030 [Gymnothorax javanicus]|nr:hypothetical protein GJAV_G00204030 [Gymnothorax javanicus]